MANRRKANRADPAHVAWLKCTLSPAHFLDAYGWVYDATARSWVRFTLWPCQREVVGALESEYQVVVLKARQLGLSWLVLGFGLWLMLFRPAATVLLFSRRDDEAVHLLSYRLKGMYDRLPRWMQAARVARESAHELRLSNGSSALAFPTTGGRGYTASLAIVDEADFAPDLDELLNTVKPTIDAGGKLALISTVDKSRPDSAFKRIYWGAKAGTSAWRPIFLGWDSRPDRDAAWYEAQRADVLARTGALDDLWQEYPADDVQALAPRASDARFPAEWLQRCDGVTAALGRQGSLSLFGEVDAGALYVIGADPAEGNPGSDESAAAVLRVSDGAQVAVLAGRLDPALFAARLADASAHFSNAPILVERNNHGHAVLLWLAENGCASLLPGLDGRSGWLSNARGKALLYDNAASELREGACSIADAVTLRQLASISGATLRAPEGQADDRATAFVLALAAIRWGGVRSTGASAIVAPADPIAEADTAGW